MKRRFYVKASHIATAGQCVFWCGLSAIYWPLALCLFGFCLYVKYHQPIYGRGYNGR